MPDDPLARAAALAALSDISTQLMGLKPDIFSRPDLATLNHSLWLHELPPLDGCGCWFCARARWPRRDG
ncbi:MAG TPA: hypothetical protein VKV26_21915 [Dehalococcoidia bacterium]|nr:hypothetical protein [Dehalococcoidia bacterium]